MVPLREALVIEVACQRMLGVKETVVLEAASVIVGVEQEEQGAVLPAPVVLRLQALHRLKHYRLYW